MASQNITTATTFTKTGRVNSVLITVNTGFTGTITVLDGTRPVGIVTNPATGNAFRYWSFITSLIVTTSAVGDITVNYQGNRQAN